MNVGGYDLGVWPYRSVRSISFNFVLEYCICIGRNIGTIIYMQVEIAVLVMGYIRRVGQLQCPSCSELSERSLLEAIVRHNIMEFMLVL